MSGTAPHFSRLSALLLAVLALVPAMLWPGDVSWLIDEPRLIANAWHANHDHALATAGLAGNFGVRYGPLPTQIYQLLLLATHDPFALVVLRGLLCGGVTAFALLWLARTLRLPAWFAAAVLVAPYVTMFHRLLWDASFAVPIGTLAVAALADFVQSGRARSLRVCVVASVLVPLIHPQGLPLFAAVAGWLLWRHRAELRRDRAALLGLGAVLLILHAVYFKLALDDVRWRWQHTPSANYPGQGSRWFTMLAPLLGGNLLAGFDLTANATPPAAPAWLVEAARWASRLIYPLIWCGLVIAARRAFRVWKNAGAVGPRDALAAVVVAGLAVQALLFGALRIPSGPQYFFGSFPLHVLAAWFAVEAFQRARLGLVLGGFYALGGGFITLVTMLAVHRQGFANVGWPTLRESVSVARALNHFDDATALTDVPLYQKHAQPLRTLRLLLPPPPDALRRTSGCLLITRGENHALTLVELAPDSLPTPPCRSIDITPMPKSWVPDSSQW